jgi:hypothetical protein
MAVRLPGAASHLDALQQVHAAVFEGDVGPGDQVPHGSRDKDLAGIGRRHHSSGDVHGDTADIVPAQLDLAGVQPRSELEADAGQFLPERRRTVDRPTGPVSDGDSGE